MQQQPQGGAQAAQVAEKQAQVQQKVDVKIEEIMIEKKVESKQSEPIAQELSKIENDLKDLKTKVSDKLSVLPMTELEYMKENHFYM